MRRRFILLVALMIFITTHTIYSQGYDIKVTIRNIKDSAVYLGYHFGDQKFVKDTSLVLSGDLLHFKGEDPLPPGVYFVYAPSVYFELIVNEPKFSVETDTVDYVRSMKFHGSKENDLFNKFQLNMGDRRKESQTISAKIKGLDQKKDSVEIADYRKQLQKIGEELNEYQQRIIDDNKGTYVSRLLRAMKRRVDVPVAPLDENGDPVENWQYYYVKKHFFDNLDLADSTLLRSPVYQPKIDEFMEKMTFRHPDSIALSADFVLNKCESNRETFRYNLVKLTNKYETSNIMGMERVFLHLAENYYLTGRAYWADSELLEKFEEKVKDLSPNQIGNIAPEIVGRDTTLQLVTLNSVPNRYIVLFFYDPDCGHCKKVMNTLKGVYENLRDKDVEVFAACTVTDVDKWKKYVKTNQLEWINVSDPYYQSNFRADYDLKTTPIIYILNSDKEIIAKKIGAEQVEDFINRMIEIEEG
ncbi:redoxin domain-containing protein [Bacteroidota bacterium]